MKHSLFLMILLLSLSCTSRSQAKRDSIIDTLSDSLSATDSIPPTDTLRLLFVGDLMQHQGQINVARTSTGYDYSTCFTYVKEEIGRADLAIANLEVTLGGKPYKGYPAFSAPDEFLTAIHDAGFNVLVTANNHSLDRGKSGLERTIQLIDSLKIPHAGTYINTEERDKKYPLLLEKNGFRIALLNYTYGTNGIPVTPPNIVNYIDTTVIAKDIEESKTMKPDAIIACMHWGIEYQSLPDKEQKFLADWLIQKGVNHVIGSHPHVVQPIEVRTDSVTNDAPCVELLVGDAPGLNPCEALFVLLAVRLEDGIVGLLLCPLAERADLAAALFAVLHGALAILCAHTAGLREPAAAVLAAAHGHAALDAASQRIVDHIPHGGRVQNRRTAARFDRFKAQRNRLKSEQRRISRLVVMVVFRRLFLRLTTSGIYVQHTFQKLLNLLPCL